LTDLAHQETDSNKEADKYSAQYCHHAEAWKSFSGLRKGQCDKKKQNCGSLGADKRYSRGKNSS